MPTVSLNVHLHVPGKTHVFISWINTWAWNRWILWCKEIEENNRMGKLRILFKKIRDTKGTFYAKMGTIKDKNGMDLTEAEDIKKR